MAIETLAGLITGAGIELPAVPKRQVRRTSAYSTSGYEGASRGRRMAGMLAAGDALNALLLASGEDLRGRSRKLVRENAWASSALDEWCASAIGTGIIPQPKINDPELKRAVLDLWGDWTDEADADGLTDFYGLQALIWRSMMEGGECFIRIRPRRPQDGLSVPLQLQVLEAEHCPATKTEKAENGNRIVGGIEFDAIGRRVAYHLYREHPKSGTAALFLNDPQKMTRVPASEVIHLFTPIRPGQLRGEPWLTRTILKLYNLDKWDSSTLDRAALGAMFLGWTTETNPDEDPLFRSQQTLSESTGADGQALDDEAAPDGTEFAQIEPNSVMRFRPGEQFDFFKQPDVGQNYAPFYESQLRWVAQAVKSLPYENLTGDVSKVNFSSARIRRIAFKRVVEQQQYAVIVFQFCRRVWNAWLDAAVLSGALEIPDYAGNPRPWRRVNWRTPKWEYTNPLQEAQADALLVDKLMKARSDVAAETTGEDGEVLDDRIAADQEREERLKLKRRDTKTSNVASDGQDPQQGQPATGGNE